MDPMDYTMDDGHSHSHSHSHSHQQPSAAHRYQCQQHQPQLSSTANTFVPLHRDTQPYDPVHDSSAWYQAPNANAPTRPSYTSPHNIPQWMPNTYSPLTSWQPFGGVQQPPAQGQDSSNFRMRGFLDMSWEESRAFSSASFGFGSYPSASNSHNVSVEPGSVRNTAQAQTPAANTPQMPPGFGPESAQLNMMQQEFLRNRPNRFNGRALPTPSSEPIQQRADESLLENASRHPHPPPGLADLNRAATGILRTRFNNAMSRAHGIDSPHPRRRAGTWDSDDDDDSVPEVEGEAAYRRNAEILFSGEGDDERSLAAMRGAIASGKKIPTREAIAALEIVKVDDLPDKNCIICYNEFGVCNPEGITESPIRLPKCKHVFGDKCIKKWFEDSDSCPYCRDKLPSELAIKKSSLAYETYRTARVAAVRPRYPPRYSVSDDHHGSPTTTAAQRAHDEYEYMLARSNESWAYSPPNRSSPADSPDSRRRQARGRVGNSRSAHMLGRPTSTGSATRWMNPAASHQITSQRSHNFTTTPSSYNTTAGQRRSITPGLPRQNSGNTAPSPNTTPPRFRETPGISSSTSSSEAASPPVAVGSGVLAREETERRAAAVLRREMDAITRLSSEDWSTGLDLFTSSHAQEYSPGSPIRMRQHPSNITPESPMFDGLTGVTTPLSPQPADDIPRRQITTRNSLQEPMSGIPQPRWSR